MKVKLIATYGSLAHEKQPCYSFCGQTATASAAECQKEVWVEVPEELEPHYNAEMDDIIITVAGGDYRLADLVSNHGREPCVMVPTFPYRRLANMANDIVLRRATAPEEA